MRHLASDLLTGLPPTPARAPGDLRLFPLPATRDLGEAIAAGLGIAPDDLEVRGYEDGEHKVRPLADVAGRRAVVVESLYGDDHDSVHDKLCRLLFLLGALGDAGASRVTAVVPYLCYSRQDRRFQPGDPLTHRFVAQLFEAVGVDDVVVLDVHNRAAFENAFRCRTVHLEAAELFARHFARHLRGREAAVVAPDAGAVQRAGRLQSTLQQVLGDAVGEAFLEKHRVDSVEDVGAVVGDVRGRTAIIVDDLIATGKTITLAAEACRAQGAASVCVAATHATFVGDASALLAKPAIDEIVITDTIPPFRLHREVRGKLAVLPTADLFAGALRRPATAG